MKQQFIMKHMTAAIPDRYRLGEFIFYMISRYCLMLNAALALDYNI